MPSVDPDRSMSGKSITQKKTPNKNIPPGVSQSYPQFLATLPTDTVMVTYFGVFKYGDVGPDCLLHETFDLQRAARPQDGRTDRSDPMDPPWIPLPVLGPCAA